jgi:hypothetical protein
VTTINIKAGDFSFKARLEEKLAPKTCALFGPLKEGLHVHDVSLYDIGFITVLSFVVAIIPVEIHKWFGRRRQQKETDARK